MRERFVQLLQDKVDKTTFGVSIDSRVESVSADRLRALYHEWVSADDVFFLNSLQSIHMPVDSVAEFTRELATLLEDCIYDDCIGNNFFALRVSLLCCPFQDSPGKSSVQQPSEERDW